MMIFHTGQGTQGIMRPPSDQQLDAVFGTKNKDDAIKIILEKGDLQKASKCLSRSFFIFLKGEVIYIFRFALFQRPKMATRQPMMEMQVTILFQQV